MGGRIVFDANFCRTCKVCEMVCSIAKEGQARPALSHIKVVFDEFSETEPIEANVCAQCLDAPCIDSCPLEAMQRDTRTGTVLVNEESCTGCMECREACPWDVPDEHPDRRVAIKCDLCADREEGPLCVQMCPLSGKALRLEPYVDAEERRVK